MPCHAGGHTPYVVALVASPKAHLPCIALRYLSKSSRTIIPLTFYSDLLYCVHRGVGDTRPPSTRRVIQCGECCSLHDYPCEKPPLLNRRLPLEEKTCHKEKNGHLPSKFRPKRISLSIHKQYVYYLCAHIRPSSAAIPLLLYNSMYHHHLLLIFRDPTPTCTIAQIHSLLLAYNS